jgi:hypothetical protein
MAERGEVWISISRPGKGEIKRGFLATKINKLILISNLFVNGQNLQKV